MTDLDKSINNALALANFPSKSWQSGILAAQTALNVITSGPEWYKAANRSDMAAAMVEFAEFLESYGYTWWKPSKPDRQNCMIELADMLFFVASDTARTANPNHGLENNALDRLVIRIIGSALKLSDMEVLISDAGFALDDILHVYRGKFALNLLRRKYGQQSGKYVKRWPPAVMSNFALQPIPGAPQETWGEDNKVLMTVLNHWPDWTPVEVFRILEEYYLILTHSAEAK